jgi:hypothetical protein
MQATSCIERMSLCAVSKPLKTSSLLLLAGITAAGIAAAGMHAIQDVTHQHVCNREGGPPGPGCA